MKVWLGLTLGALLLVAVCCGCRKTGKPEPVRPRVAKIDPRVAKIDATLLLKHGFVKKGSGHIYTRSGVTLGELEDILDIEHLFLEPIPNSAHGDATCNMRLPGGAWLVVSFPSGRSADDASFNPLPDRSSIVHAAVDLDPIWLDPAKYRERIRIQRERSIAQTRAAAVAAKEFGPDAETFVARMSAVKIGWTEAQLRKHAGKPNSSGRKFDEALWIYKAQGVFQCSFAFFLKGGVVTHFSCEFTPPPPP